MGASRYLTVQSSIHVSIMVNDVEGFSCSLVSVFFDEKFVQIFCPLLMAYLPRVLKNT